VPTLASVKKIAERPRDYVGVRGPDAEGLLQRLVSNDVAQAPCEALLLTPKARVVATLVVVRRGPDDFLLLTEPGLGDLVRDTLLRARFAAKVEIESEQHRSHVVFGAGDGIPNRDYGEPAVEVVDAELEPTIDSDELERMRIEAGTPRYGSEIDERVLPAEAGLIARAVSLTKGCYPGQEPVARLHYRGHVNRMLRVLRLESGEPPEPGAEIRHGDKVVGRVTSAARSDGGIVALGYVRVEVPAGAELEVGTARARVH
jgi:tRNA-modifying protein YgfZ